LTDATAAIRRCWDDGPLGGRDWLDNRRFNDDVSTGLVGSAVHLVEKGSSLLLLASHFRRV
jgi:hypothetical protein